MLTSPLVAPRAWRSLAAILLVLAAGCEPFADEGEPCVEVPCAFGLICVEGICEREEDADAGFGRCEQDRHCAIDGNADGRQCLDGDCRWTECSFDQQCGTRICERGACAVREACAFDDDCDDGKVCDDDACRAPCEGDEQCTGLFQACGDDGRCRQQCFSDLLCFGGLCEGGVCVEPECSDDGHCEQEGSWFCNEGRCESFLPCEQDSQCFDPNYRCSELGRCEERPLCARDDECGLEGLCINGHCRPTESCLVDEDACSAGQECVAGRCANAPACRANADCDAGQVCARGSCRAEVLTEAAHVVVETALGPCFEDASLPGTAPCTLTLFMGEEARVRFGALDASSAPVRAALEARVQGVPTLTLTDVSADGALVSAVALGDEGVLEVQAGAVTTHVPVRVVPSAPAGGLHVLVVDERSGAPVEGALVSAAGQSATTSAEGLAVFAVAPSSAPTLLWAREGARGIAVADIVPVGDLRLALPAASPDESGAAGFTTRITSSGSQLGPVGIGLALPSVERLSRVSAAALFGPPFVGTLEVPLLGGLPVSLPAAATLTATLPLVGTTADVRPLAYATTQPGPRAVTAFEGRSELGALFALTGGGDGTERLLDLAEGAEAMGALTRHVAVLASVPRVPDADDLDGDGDTSALRPDFESFPNVEVSPAARPNERIGLILGPPPTGARARVLVVAGLLPAGYGFVPTGVAAPALEDSAPRQLKAAPPALDGLTAARRALVAEALFDDGRQSRLMAVSESFAPVQELGGFLAPPMGATFLDGVPLPDHRLLLLPEAAAATTYRVTLDGAGARWHLYVPVAEGGRSLRVDEALGGLSALLGPVAVFRFDDTGSGDPTHRRFQAGSGPVVPAEDAAPAWAAAP